MIPAEVLERWAAASTPEVIELQQRRYHERNHAWSRRESFEDCWHCGRHRARCRSKLRFGSLEGAQNLCDDINTPNRERLVIPYRCRWSEGLHFHVRTTVGSKERRTARKRMARRYAGVEQRA